MAVDEEQRERAILDAAADLLLRFGYHKLTMGDVADAVDLHRGLVYLRFTSKDELVTAVVVRELDRYALEWREQLAADPEGGSVGSVGRAMLGALKTLPLASAIVAEDEEVFGKYLRKNRDLFERKAGIAGVRASLDAMREAGVVRQDVDTAAVAFIVTSLTPAVRRSFLRANQPAADADQPSWEQVLRTLSDMLDRTLTPPGGADLAAGKALLLGAVDRTRAELAARHKKSTRPRGDDHA